MSINGGDSGHRETGHGVIIRTKEDGALDHMGRGRVGGQLSEF